MLTATPTRIDTCPKCGQNIEVRNGMWLRRKRLAARISLRVLADRLSLSAPYLCDIERNRRVCTDEIADAYDKL